MSRVDLFLIKRMRYGAFAFSLLAVSVAIFAILSHFAEPVSDLIVQMGDHKVTLGAAVLYLILNLNQLLYLTKIEFYEGQVCRWVPMCSALIFGVSGLLFFREVGLLELFTHVRSIDIFPKWEACLSFMFLSMAQFMLYQRNVKLQWFYLGPLVVLILSFTRLIAIGLDVPTILWPILPIRYSNHLPMIGVVSMALSSMGILWSRPDRSFMQLMASPTGGGLLVRKIINSVVIVPLAIGVLSSIAWRLQIFEVSTLNSLIVTSFLMSLIWVVWSTANQLEKSDWEKAQLEHALNQSHQVLDLMLTSLPVGVWFTDINGQIIRMNPMARSIWGEPEQILNGCPLQAKAWSLESGERAIPNLRAQEPLSQRFLVQSPAGELRVISASSVPVRGEKNESLGTVILNVDMSDSFKFERQNRILARAGFELFESSELSVLMERAVQLPVPDLCDICFLGFGKDFSSLQWVSSEVNETFPAELVATATEVLREGRSRTFAYNGFEGLAVPLCSPQGTNGVFVLITTISGRPFDANIQQTAEELGRLSGMAFSSSVINKNLEAAIRAREDVCAMVSHDLRNPLGAVIGVADLLAEILKDQDRVRPQLTELLGILKKASRRMFQMVGDLLEVSKMEQGVLRISCQATRLKEIVGEVHDVFRSEADSAGVRLLTEIEAELDDLYCDPGRLFQIFSNLISNSLKHCLEGDQIVIRARAMNSTCLQMSIEDSGCGIDPENLPHIFDRYWQPHKSTCSGAGLGLFIVKGIVDAHGGQIWAESTKGQGTKIYFTLPTVAHSLGEGPSAKKTLNDRAV